MSFGYTDFVGVPKYYLKLLLELSIASKDALGFVILSLKVRIIEIVTYNRFELVKCVTSEKSSGI